MRDQTTKNIDLAFQMIEEAIERPSLLDDIPDGATVVVMPSDDPELPQQNLSLPMRLAEAGKTVVPHHAALPCQPHLARLLKQAKIIPAADRPDALETPSELTDEVGHLIA
ncbi:MAG: DUF5647 family protein [Thermomicrobiales bacterium]